MNDFELDRLLDMWETPAPSSSLRRGLRGRFPRMERRFVRPWCWVLAVAAISISLVIALGQETGNSAASFVFGTIFEWYENIQRGFELQQAGDIRNAIRQSNPQAYVDGLPIGPPEFGNAATMNLLVPGEGLVSITLVSGLNGWLRAGRLRGTELEFQLGRHRVRIECSRSMTDRDLPVFIRLVPAL
jgi:hypothetical protein